MDPVVVALNDVLLLHSAAKTASRIRSTLSEKLNHALEHASVDDVELVRQVIEQSTKKGRWPPDLLERMRSRVGAQTVFNAEDSIQP